MEIIATSIDEKAAPRACQLCAVRARGACCVLGDVELRSLNMMSSRKVLGAGEYFVFEGDPVEQVAQVVRGTVKLVQGFEDGREQIVGLLFPGDFIGSTRLLRPGTHTATVEAAGEVELCVYPVVPFRRLMESRPALEHFMLQRAGEELDHAREWMSMLGRMTALERVSAFLFHLISRDQTGEDGRSLVLPLTRAEMADVTGLTLETVSRQFSWLRKQGIITMSDARTLTGYSLPRLLACAGRVPCTISADLAMAAE